MSRSKTLQSYNLCPGQMRHLEMLSEWLRNETEHMAIECSLLADFVAYRDNERKSKATAEQKLASEKETIRLQEKLNKGLKKHQEITEKTVKKKKTVGAIVDQTKPTDKSSTNEEQASKQLTEQNELLKSVKKQKKSVKCTIKHQDINRKLIEQKKISDDKNLKQIDSEKDKIIQEKKTEDSVEQKTRNEEVTKRFKDIKLTIKSKGEESSIKTIKLKESNKSIKQQQSQQNHNTEKKIDAKPTHFHYGDDYVKLKKNASLSSDDQFKPFPEVLERLKEYAGLKPSKDDVPITELYKTIKLFNFTTFNLKDVTEVCNKMFVEMNKYESAENNPMATYSAEIKKNPQDYSYIGRNNIYKIDSISSTNGNVDV